MSRWLGVVGIMLGVLLIGCDAISTATPEVATNVGQSLPISAQAQIGDRLISLEVASTRQQQATGLMGRTSLADDRGMLFEFKPPQNVSFWMKNVRIPLDMIFLRDDKVKAIASSVPPCTAEPCPTYGPDDTTIDRVIELRGGRAAELGLEVGETVSIKFLPAKK